MIVECNFNLTITEKLIQTSERLQV